MGQDFPPYRGDYYGTRCSLSLQRLNFSFFIMREYYFKDKRTNVSYRGYHATTEINCPPFDYYRYTYAHNKANLIFDILKMKSQESISEELVRKFSLEQTDKTLANMLANSKPNPTIHQLLSDNNLSNKDQIRILKGLTLNAIDILWLNKNAQDMGYLLDVFYEEKYPEKFNNKKQPLLIHKKDDGTIEKMGQTDMTVGEMRALLEQRKVIQARIYHKNDIWHCFYFTYKGLAGEESGLMGSKPHYHYLSDKSGISWNILVKSIKDCDMPTSNVHIIINR